MQTLGLLIALSMATAQSEGASSSKKSVAAPGGFGIGVQTTLRGLGGAELSGLGPDAGISVVIDQQKWRVDTLLNFIFVEDNATAFGIGGRFLYVLHTTSMADFSAGGGVGLQFTDIEFDDDDDGFAAYFEGVGQIRVFVVPNVSVNATLGLGFRVGEGPETVGLVGQAHGSFGLTYFF